MKATSIDHATGFPSEPMPTLFRYLTILITMAGIGFAAMLALATFVAPQPQEMAVPIAPTRFAP